MAEATEATGSVGDGDDDDDGDDEGEDDGDDDGNDDGEDDADGGEGRERASATGFADPGRWRMSEVNSAKYAKCRCWRAERGEEVRRRAAVSGL